MRTVLITGCSSGFGLETARQFLAREWNVVATMRSPREDILPASDRLRVLALDVTDPESIRRALEAAGPIDVLVNNAGVGLLNALEGTPMETARELFETNTLGTIAMTQAVLPQMRERRAGVIVNVTSSVTLKSLPLLSVYTATKAAVNAFTECLDLELAGLGVRTHLVLPGQSPETRFAESARARMQAVPAAYAGLAEAFLERMQEPGPVTHASDVAQSVWRAATDSAAPFRIVSGADALALVEPVVAAAQSS